MDGLIEGNAAKMSRQNPKSTCPWIDLDEEGTGLTVDNFLTTRLSQVSNAMRRDVTARYAEQHGLSVSEWRVLSLIAHSKRLPFSELVIQSTSDKALVSRAARLLEGRGLVKICPEDPSAGKRLRCDITSAGSALHAMVMPQARREQAQVLRTMSSEQRQNLFQALQVLRQHLLPQDEAGQTAKLAKVTKRALKPR
jgi:DNA-binding MarR family transcriptional regulator